MPSQWLRNPAHGSHRAARGHQRPGRIAGKRILEAETAAAEAEVAVHKIIQTLVNLGLPITYDEVLQTPADELRRKIRFLGLPPEIVQELDSARTTSNLIPVFAPRDGIIVTRDVVAGEVIDTTRTLFTVTDTRRMWMVLNVPLEEAKHVAVGQQVVFRPRGLVDDPAERRHFP